MATSSARLAPAPDQINGSSAIFPSFDPPRSWTVDLDPLAPLADLADPCAEALTWVQAAGPVTLETETTEAVLAQDTTWTALRAFNDLALQTIVLNQRGDDQDGGAAIRLAVEKFLTDRVEPAFHDLRVGVGEGLLPMTAAADAAIPGDPLRARRWDHGVLARDPALTASGQK